MEPRSPATIAELPHAAGRIPILGDLTSIDRKRPTQHELSLAADLGPIFARKILNSSLVIVAGGELATQCSDEQHWARGLAGPGAMLRRLATDGLFTARSSDPLWGQARRILTPGFTQHAMRSYHHAMQTVADDLITEWSSTTGTVDAHSAMTRATLEVIGRAGFTRNLGLFPHEPTTGTPEQANAKSHAFVDALSDTLQWASESTNDLPIIGTARRLLRDRTVGRNIARIRDFVDDIVAERTTTPTDDTDLLNLMLSTHDPDTGSALPADNIRNQVITFLIAGHETTAALLEVALHHLAADQSLQDRLRAETTQRQSFDYTAVTGMRLIRQTLNECLRMWPPVPGYFRVARSDHNLGGYLIPAGRSVFVLALAAQRDTTVWGPTAAHFDPDRFETERLRQYPHRFFQPWGVSPRACIGRAFALHEATLLIARILTEFTLIGDGSPLNLYERGTLRPTPYHIKVVPRS